MDIPKGATSVILPRNEKVVLFAATLVAENEPATTVSGTLFRTNNVSNAATAGNDEEAVREKYPEKS